jgi:hypothetical protein
MKNNWYDDRAKKNKLWGLIKSYCQYCGETDNDFIVEYAKEVLNKNHIDSAIACFDDLMKQARETNREYFRITDDRLRRK